MNCKTDLENLLDKYRDVKIEFGNKYKGFTLKEIYLMKNGKNYLIWMTEKFDREITKKKYPQIYNFINEFDPYVKMMKQVNDFDRFGIAQKAC